MDTFKHTPLNITAREIRLLRVAPIAPPAPSSQLRRCGLWLEHHDIEKAPRYIALSYTWGPSTPRYPIAVANRIFEVRENLHHFLSLLISGKIKRDVVRKEVFYIWIDQMCIDQSNALEKNHQVQQMGVIFGRAHQVIAFLGHSAVTERFVDRSSSRSDVAEIKADQNVPPTIWRDPGVLDPAVFRLAYWTRLWVIQELMLAQHVVFLKSTGQHHEVIDWLELVEFLHSLKAGRVNLQSWLGPANALIQMKAAATLTKGCAKNTSLPLSVLLKKFSHLDCEEPRDKIYALLSICATSLDVDYDKAVVEVFRSAMDVVASSLTLGHEMNTFVDLGVRMGLDRDKSERIVRFGLTADPASG